MATISRLRIRKMAQGRRLRNHKWRCDIKKSIPCSLGVMGYPSGFAHEFQRGNDQLDAARLPVDGNDLAGHNKGALLGGLVRNPPGIGINAVHGYDALHQSRTVPQHEKQQMLRAALIVQAALEYNLLPLVRSQFLNGYMPEPGIGVGHQRKCLGGEPTAPVNDDTASIASWGVIARPGHWNAVTRNYQTR